VPGRCCSRAGFSAGRGEVVRRAGGEITVAVPRRESAAADWRDVGTWILRARRASRERALFFWAGEGAGGPGAEVEP